MTLQSSPLHLLSGGAAQGLVAQLQAGFEAAHACNLSGTFGAVGMMKDRLLSGAPCDVVILTRAMIDQLTASGELVAGSAQDLGVVKTGIAVKTGDAPVDVSTPAQLKAALQAATGIYFPDPVKATAGIHVMNVLKALGLDTELADRLRPFPNGATAMTAMAQCAEPGLIGCTQITEILYIDGVELVAPLPEAFELATVYTAAVCRRSTAPALAAELIASMTGADSAGLRQRCGFEG